MPILEIVTFYLAPGTTDAAFVAAAKGTEAPLRLQPGFISRRLAKGKDDQWTDFVVWQSMAQAMAAADTLMQDAAFAPFMALIDPTAMTMRHDTVMWQMD